MKHICLDTETTGFDPVKGDRIVEIACIEVENFMPTGRQYHQYINPQRSMPEGAFKVHGLSDSFLKEYPVFKNIAKEFVDFIQDLPLVIHNAKFDMKFLNYELSLCGFTKMSMTRSIDTLAIARKKFPGSPATLDALCKRFDVSLKDRSLHGALIDTQLLAEVFLHLNEGYAPRLHLDTKHNTQGIEENNNTSYQARQRKNALPSSLTQSEKEKHDLFITDKIKNALWKK